MKQESWFLRGFLLVIVLLVFHLHTVPTKAYWIDHYFNASHGSQVRIATEVSSLEWTVGEKYEVTIFVIALNFTPNVDRLYNIWIECKWESGNLEAAKTPNEPSELTLSNSWTNASFPFFPVTIRNESLYYRVNITEGTNDGTDASWSSDWQKTFVISTKHKESSGQNEMIGIIALFLMVLVFLPMIGSKRGSE